MTATAWRKVMAVTAAAAMVGAIALAVGCGKGRGASCPPKQLIKAGDSVTDMQLTGLDGKPVNLKAMIEGKVALVDVWATWCGPCKLAMPHLQAMYNRYKDRGMLVVGVLTDDNATRIGAEYMKDNPIGYPIVLDDAGSTFDCAWGQVTGIPLMVLVGRDGKVLDVFQGTGDLGTLQRRLEQLMTAAPAA